MLADNTFAMSAPTMTGVHAAEFDVRYGALLNSTIDWTPHGTWLDHRVVARPPRKHRASGRHAANAHHRAYVGPKNRYGDMAASMFSLLYFSGLRETSKLLDVGCGSLRLGRIAIPFLQRGNYHCIEPSLVALRAGLQHELGTDLLRLKWPSFAINSAFEPPANADAVRSYDYLIAQSFLPTRRRTSSSSLCANSTGRCQAAVCSSRHLSCTPQASRRRRIGAMPTPSAAGCTPNASRMSARASRLSLRASNSERSSSAGRTTLRSGSRSAASSQQAARASRRRYPHCGASRGR